MRIFIKILKGKFVLKKTRHTPELVYGFRSKAQDVPESHILRYVLITI